ncbi:MAG: GNAT family protein [Bacteroidota bacterium]|jgi:RimJ/RimL family protein N-acetyltransferase
MNIIPVTLEGTYVRLEPLSPAHHAQLCDAGLGEDWWEFTTSVMRLPDDMRRYVETALQWQAQGTALPFAIIEKNSGTAVGSTRFANIDKSNRRLEIGWTWIGKQWQRTSVNTETKYLMLGHAFETLGCIRVEFKTDSLNQKSRTALLRIGAKEEGIFRNHMITPSGRIRHSVYFSIVDSEWRDVKARLEKLMRSRCGSTSTNR